MSLLPGSYYVLSFNVETSLNCSFRKLSASETTDAGIAEQEAFTCTYWVCFTQGEDARQAKIKLDEHYLVGGYLHMMYAPQFESVAETRAKLAARRTMVQQGHIRATTSTTASSSSSSTTTAVTTIFSPPPIALPLIPPADPTAPSEVFKPNFSFSLSF